MRLLDPETVRPRLIRRIHPVLEDLEGRALLSSHPLGPALPGRHYPARDVQQFIPRLYPPATPQPTSQEVARESFSAKSVGTYTIGPGHFADQALTIKGGGKKSTSNMQFVNRFQFILFEPKDPTQPVTGTINYLSGNYLSSGSSIYLDYKSPTGTEVNGLPKTLEWTHDSASGSTFTGAGTSPLFSQVPTIVDFNLGAGQSSFKFIPDAHPTPGSLGSGHVIIITKGLLNTAPNNPIDKNYE